MNSLASKRSETAPPVAARVLKTLLATTLLATAILPSPGLAMDPKGEKWRNRPTFQSIDNEGVELYSGLYVLKDEDLSIGSADQGGLTFARYYAPRAWDSSPPNLETYPFSQDITHNLDLRAVGSYDASDDPTTGQTAGERIISVLFNTDILTFRQDGFERQVDPNVYRADVVGTSVTVNGDDLTVTTKDGTIIRLNRRGHDCGSINTVPMICAYGTSVEMPTGETLTYEWQVVTTSPDVQRLKSVRSNRGYAIVFDYPTTTATQATKACAVNLAEHYLGALANCPAGAKAATYSGSSFTKPDGRTTTWNMSTPGLFTFERQGVTGKEIVHMSEGRVSSIDYGVVNGVATGGTRSYSYLPANYVDGRGYGNYQTTVTEADGGVSIYYFKNQVTSAGRWVDPVIEWKQDPLGRKTYYEYWGLSQVRKETRPEGDRTEHTYDYSGNRLTTTHFPKPGSSLSASATSWTYPQSCTNKKICAKPLTMTDGRQHTTDYTYDPNHGGMLTETGPAVNGVRPQKRFTYAQRYAWIRNSAGGYSRAATPVWLLVKEASCKTGAASGNGCAIAGDEVVTEYDYGPDSGPNNLLLRGTVVDPGGLNLRTCYRYDSQGNKIVETAPKAGLTSCQ